MKKDISSIGKNVHIAAFTHYLWTPSSRYRIRQYFEPIESAYPVKVHDFAFLCGSENVALRLKGSRRLRYSPLSLLAALISQVFQYLARLYTILKANASCDAFWISREIIVGCPTLLPLLLLRPVIYDIDDAVYLGNLILRFDVYLLIKRARIIIAGNEFLASYCRQLAPKAHLLILPTAVNTTKYQLALSKQNINYLSNREQKRSFLWSGTSSSFGYLAEIADSIYSFLSEQPNAFQLIILADLEPPFMATWPESCYKFVKWSPSAEQYCFETASLGLMPLGNDDWCRGKCAYKMLTYASAGFPTLSSRFGVNEEILTRFPQLGTLVDSDWYHALDLFFDQRWPFSPSDISQIVEDHFSVQRVYPLLASALLEITK